MGYSARGRAKKSVLSRNQWSGILFGLGLVAFIDEVVFHQLLHWHHFYDRSTTAIGLVSDGLFHAFSWFATVASLFMLADLRRRGEWIITRWWGFVLIGAGSFQLYDGIIQHKLLKIHQIRYVENVLIYDIVWNVTAVLLIIAGIMVVFKAKKKRKGSQSDGTSSSSITE
ncbi:DUF2243 domain-containing protein [Gracilibacillus oryzae]|uniref:DUF2243 domain-containing protein n=1 Tax=Gracilibacillus oryzae TaxID=1672701 RepID=A0A7C8GTS5_9BACI|nr:DUF2243 domain-containing protein [Gracilibacillus oryzae]KAB8137820.1 DUF2243 domain-containing protein [Gracilibacillus oryzae]